MASVTILGIETSCDETAAAIVRADPAGSEAGNGAGRNERILSNMVLSQIDEHKLYGGVVPEIAARAHMDHLDRLIEAALEEAGIGIGEIDAVAATAGPGLIGGVLVGVVTAKALALAAAKPFIAINHLEGHALSARLVEDVAFPYLLLLISGGHCQLLAVEGVGQYRRLGTTIDDAAGEAFDKTAKLMGLGYPGGPAVEEAAAKGVAGRFALPRPLIRSDNCDFSFSGLKTAVRRQVETLRDAGELDDGSAADLAAEFQAAICDCLTDRSARAMALFSGAHEFAGPEKPAFVVAGGVAANSAIKNRLESLATEEGFRFVAPPVWLCTDNAAMIAWAGVERFALGLTDPLDAPARARWPLDETSGTVVGSGRRGAKV